MGFLRNVLTIGGKKTKKQNLNAEYGSHEQTNLAFFPPIRLPQIKVHARRILNQESTADSEGESARSRDSAKQCICVLVIRHVAPETDVSENAVSCKCAVIYKITIAHTHTHTRAHSRI